MATLKSCIQKSEEEWFRIKDPETVPFPDKGKILNDTLYGTIKLEQPLVYLIDLPCFQRLRRIRQLGFVDLVYPGAHHTRFEHSIGTAHLSSLFLSTLREKSTELWNILQLETTLESEIASLYHDIGHLPFSHVTEALLFEEKELNDIEDEENLEDVKPHEILSSQFVRGKYISKALERINNELGYDLSPESISGIMLGKAPEGQNHCRFLGQLLHGAVDVDRIDYLSRDGIYTGVPFGKIDLGRMLHTFNVHNDIKGAIDLVVEYKGLQTIESMIVARALMYSSVYHHHTSRALSSLYSRLVFSYLDKKRASSFKLCNFDDITLRNELCSSPDCVTTVKDIEYRKIPKTALQLRSRNITDIINFDGFTENLTLGTFIEIEEEIGRGTLLDIPKYEKYDEIGIFIQSEDEVKPISEYSNIAKGIEENPNFGWLGYVFAKNENRDEVADLAKKYFDSHCFGIRIDR